MKNKYEASKQKIIQQLPLLVFLYCIFQPLLDVASYWQERLEISNALTVVLRMVLLCGSVALGFALSERKRYYWLMGGVLGAFLAGHVWACTQAGYLRPFGDLSNMLRIYLLPLTTLCLCTFLRKNSRVKESLIAAMAVNLGIIIAVMLLSRLTGTDPYTYPNKALGVRGWFYLPNSQSAILAMIVPVSIGWALEKWQKRLLPAAAVTAAGLGALFALGTRLAFASLAAAGMGIAVCLLVIDRRRWRQSLTIGCIAIVLAAMLPVSPMVRNQQAVAKNFQIKQAAFDRVAGATQNAQQPRQDAALGEAYRLFVPGMLDRFGEERVLEAYHYSTDVGVVGNQRTMKRIFCTLLMENSPESAQWFGLNRSQLEVKAMQTDVLTGQTREQVTWYDPENDFHAIYYLCGGVGLVLMVGFIGYFAIRALLALALDFKHKFTVEFAAFSIAACCAVAHCYFTASILRFNSASVYLAMLLAVIWYLSKRGGAPQPKNAAV